MSPQSHSGVLDYANLFVSDKYLAIIPFASCTFKSRIQDCGPLASALWERLIIPHLFSYRPKYTYTQTMRQEKLVLGNSMGPYANCLKILSEFKRFIVI